jgi:Transposase DDE domain group 1
VDNQVRLQLFVLAYNLGNFLRQAVLPKAARHWTLATLREKLIKIGAKVAPFTEDRLPYGVGGGAARVVPLHSTGD